MGYILLIVKGVHLTIVDQKFQEYGLSYGLSPLFHILLYHIERPSTVVQDAIMPTIITQ